MRTKEEEGFRLRPSTAAAADAAKSLNRTLPSSPAGQTPARRCVIPPLSLCVALPPQQQFDGRCAASSASPASSSPSSSPIRRKVLHQIIFKAFEEAKGADFVLCNTVQELEPETISAMRQGKPFYAVSPLIPPGFPGISLRTTLQVESDCSHWLDTKPAGSVLYISFGSLANVSKRDLEEIAYGILDSKANFLWVVRLDIVSTEEHEPLPQKFLEEVHGRGICIPWCCQMEVLSHPSIGGFLTHCGWNSILESVWCEVPMLCFPLQTDQFINRKLVVRDWKIGIDLGRIDEVSRREVSKRVDSLMGGEEGNEAEKRMKEVIGSLDRPRKADPPPNSNFFNTYF